MNSCIKVSKQTKLLDLAHIESRNVQKKTLNREHNLSRTNVAAHYLLVLFILLYSTLIITILLFLLLLLLLLFEC
jgi:hypothetical protein